MTTRYDNILYILNNERNPEYQGKRLLLETYNMFKAMDLDSLKQLNDLLETNEYAFDTFEQSVIDMDEFTQALRDSIGLLEMQQNELLQIFYGLKNTAGIEIPTQQTHEQEQKPLYDSKGYINKTQVKRIIFQAFSRPRAVGGRLFYQELETVSGTIVYHTGNTSSTKGYNFHEDNTTKSFYEQKQKFIKDLAKDNKAIYY